MDDEIFHYGVKGMKWGKRKKYTPEDRERTALSRKDKDKSAHRLAAEAKFVEKGLSRREAVIAAEKRIRAQKVAAVVGGVALTAVAVYAGQKAFEQRFTGVDLGLDTPLRNINALGDDQKFDRQLYVSYKKADTDKYRGLYGMALKKNSQFLGDGSGKVYEHVLKPTERIKAPSHVEAQKIYKQVYEEVTGTKPKLPPLNKRFADAVEKNIAGDPRPVDYKQFNKKLTSQLSMGLDDNLKDAFNKALKDRGYNSLLDANDQFLSGYKTRKPLILLDAAASTSVKGYSALDDGIMAQKYIKNMGKIMIAAYAPTIGGIVGVSKAGDALENRKSKKAVDSYMREHPESKLSYQEAFNLAKKGKL